MVVLLLLRKQLSELTSILGGNPYSSAVDLSSGFSYLAKPRLEMAHWANAIARITTGWTTFYSKLSTDWSWIDGGGFLLSVSGSLYGNLAENSWLFIISWSIFILGLFCKQRTLTYYFMSHLFPIWWLVTSLTYWFTKTISLRLKKVSGGKQSSPSSLKF